MDPQLDFSNLPRLRELYERCTKMHVGERQPYAGELVFTAFSGSHQDAINKGMQYMKESGTDYWEIPYLPIDPADVGRQYEPIIRINSQSGKGGAAFVMQTSFGYTLPKAMHPEFGAMVKAACDKAGTELNPQQIFDLFRTEYIDVDGPYQLLTQKYIDESADDGSSTHGRFLGTLKNNGFPPVELSGKGNGPIDAFFNALHGVGVDGYHFEDYSEHAISFGSDAKAVSYIRLTAPSGKTVFGVGISHNIYYASIRGVLCAINRSIRQETAETAK